MMALPYWQVSKVDIGAGGDLKYASMLYALCPSCKNGMVVPRSWPRKNKYGTAPCPFCFKTNRIPEKKDIR